MLRRDGNNYIYRTINCALQWKSCMVQALGKTATILPVRESEIFVIEISHKLHLDPIIFSYPCTAHYFLEILLHLWEPGQLSRYSDCLRAGRPGGAGVRVPIG
jgi:hypothetical protein